MNRHHILCGFVFLLVCAANGFASVFGDVRGTVVDPQQRPIVAARITLVSRTSSFARTTATNDSGNFALRAVPVGEYTLAVESPGFMKTAQALVVLSDQAT